MLIWPDLDKAGWGYALTAADAGLMVGAMSCEVLMPPEDKAQGWDAADALAEGFDVPTFLASGPHITIQSHVAGEDTEEPDEKAIWATDDLALSFTRRYAQDWRYCAQWGKWLAWTGNHRQSDETLLVTHLMRHICREVAFKASSHRLAAKLASSSTVNGVERLARSERRHASTSDEWDSDPWLVNTPGGVVDLRTGKLPPHDRADRMTKITTATPKGVCPRWLAFLADTTRGDADLMSYLQRVIGYCLTGVTSAHALFFLYGTGANGKSVFVNVITTILGDYAANAPMDTFMEARTDRHPTDLAGLRGARFVSSIETEQGRRWNESKVKAITGGDKVSARFMRQDFFEYVPQFKLVIADNHKPSIRNVEFKRWLGELLTSGDISEVYFEEVRRHTGVDAAHAYGGFWAHLTAWCEHRNIPYQGMPVGTIKKHATGRGNAGKAAMIAALRLKGFQPTDDNEADAPVLLD